MIASPEPLDAASGTRPDGLPFPPGDAPEPRIDRARRSQIAASLGIALAIVIAAWFVGGRSGFRTIGEGGVNQRLLPKVGEVAPDFETRDVFGNTVRLSDFRGRPVWLNFWGSWCPPCRAEMPEIQAAYQQLEPEGLVLLAISVREPPEDALRYALQNRATFPILTDRYEQDTGAFYPLYNVPTHIFIDADGVIRAVILSDMSLDRALYAGRDVIERSLPDA